MDNKEKTMEKIVNLCKSRGFVYPGSEIYGGLANSWDYGPLGVLLKNNIKNIWIQKFVTENEHTVLIDSAILMNPQVWVASGHVGGFSDPLMDCKNCKTRHRADKLIEESGLAVNGWTFKKMEEYIKEHHIKCPACGAEDFTKIREFNLMFKTYQGVTEEKKDEIYLRPETAQGIFVNFANVLRTTRRKLPLGIAQIGKSFRNEITPGNFTFRIREFEQMELEFFCQPGTDLEWFKFWKDYCENWLLSLGIKPENIRMRDHEKEELSHYSSATSDIEFLFPFGWGELWGIADRTDFDLTQHQKFSGKNLEYFDEKTQSKYLPYVIEPSLGADRVTLAFLCNAYDEETINEKDTRVVLHLHPAIAPFKAAILPLTKKFTKEAKRIFENLSTEFTVDYDESGSIGKRYRRQDEIGTPFCFTYDFDSDADKCVTVRYRDTMQQERIAISKLNDFIRQQVKVSFPQIMM